MGDLPLTRSSETPSEATKVPRRKQFRPATAYAVALGVVWIVGQITIRVAPAEPAPHRWPDHQLLDTFARWDTGWYFHIAELGYYYNGPGVQSAVAFFPAFPAAVRAVGWFVGDLIVAGVIVSVIAGCAAVVLFHRWAVAAFDHATAAWATLLLLVSPFSYFLLGAVYSDALFLAAAVGAFLLLERGHPGWAAAVGALATATRPVGAAIVVGLFVRALELGGVLPGSRGRLGLEPGRPRIPLVPERLALARLRARHFVTIGSAAGAIGFCAFLWLRFGEPLAFIKVETAGGWGRRLDRDSLLMLDYFRRWRDYSPNLVHFGLTLQGLLSIIALGLVVPTIRRLGWGYGAYVLIVVGVPLLTSTDFIAMGRYVLVAFPIFAVAADLLRGATRSARRSVLGVSGALAVFMTVLFARWMLL